MDILLIEDNPLNQKLIRFVLLGAGYQVTIASDAEEALGVLLRKGFDAILMDLQLPGMSGLELTRTLKQDPLHAQIPIIAVSAYAMASDRRQALEAGCVGFISKPVDTRRLPQQVQQLLEQA